MGMHKWEVGEEVTESLEFVRTLRLLTVAFIALKNLMMDIGQPGSSVFASVSKGGAVGSAPN